MKFLIKLSKVLGVGTILLALITFIFMQQRSFGKLPQGERLKRIERSPQYKNGSFENIENTPMLADGVSYFGMIKDFLFSKGIDREPAEPLPVVNTNLLSLDKNIAQIIWFGHSSYLIAFKGRHILVDPMFSERASPVQYAGTKNYPVTTTYKIEDFPPVDVVVISHDHYDHLDYNTIIKLKDRTNLFCVPLGIGTHLVHWGIEENKIIELDWWESKNLFSDVTLTSTPARHFSGRGFIRNKTLWSSYALNLSGYKIFIGGDSGYDNSFKTIGDKFGPFNIALLECGQYDLQWPYIHMMPEQVVEAAIDLKTDIS